jgi:iron(III) transport system ATP-binding protein
MAKLSIDQLEYSAGNSLIIPRVRFSIADGSFACLLGPSGCGKTTLLRLIAGLERPARGSICLDDVCMSGDSNWLEPQERRIGMVFQQPTLFPTKTVAENIAFGLRGHPAPQARVAELLAHIGLEEKAGHYPHQLSGGQQHRVALARALAPTPRLLLLDEPFAHLDPDSRTRLRRETLKLIRGEGVTALMVTHDATEALQMGDTIILMDDTAHIRQQGTPHDLYHHPVDQFAALALGEMNLLSAESDGRSVRSCLGRFDVDSNLSGKVLAGFRPYDLHIGTEASDVRGVVEEVLCTGPQDQLMLKLACGDQPGDEVSVRANPERIHLFEAA